MTWWEGVILFLACIVGIPLVCLVLLWCVHQMERMSRR